MNVHSYKLSIIYFRLAVAVLLMASFLSSMVMAQAADISSDPTQAGHTAEDTSKSKEKALTWRDDSVGTSEHSIAAPANDNFASALAIGAVDAIGATNVEATGEAGEPFHGAGHGGIFSNQNNSVWFKFTAPITGVITLWTTSSGSGAMADPVMSSYSGSSIGSLSPLAENDDYPAMGNNSRITFWVFNNQTYYIAVDGYLGSTGTFTLHYTYTQAPLNDQFANAEHVGLGLTSPYIGITGSNANSTEEPGEPEHIPSPGMTSYSIWYRWTAPENRSMTFTTLGSNFATTLAVYTGTSVDSLTLVARNAEFKEGSNPRSRVTFYATAGVTYRIAIDSRLSSRGNSVLNWYPNREESSKRFDFDGDAKSDISIYRLIPGAPQWWIKKSSGGHFGLTFGTGAGCVVPADFTGDGKTDLALFNPPEGLWRIIRSDDFTYFAFPFGQSGDTPVSGKFDNDTKDDYAIFRPSTGTWWILASIDGVSARVFGMLGDKPMVGDYDGDGRSDIGIYRPSNGQWWIEQSTQGVTAAAFGAPGDVAIPGSFTGDGRTNAAVWRPSTGEWFVLRSLTGGSYYGFPFGMSGDVPAAGDYDGDGKFDAAVFRPSSGTWFIHRSQTGNVTVEPFGTWGDQPIPAARLYY